MELALFLCCLGCRGTEKSASVADSTMVGRGSWTRIADMPTPRSGAAAVAANGRLYVIGGQQGSKFLTTNESLDVATGVWTAEPPVRLARSFSATNAAVIDGTVYLVDGNPRGYCTNAADAFDSRTHAWRLLPAAPVARCHAAVLAANGAVYALGGWNTSSTVHYVSVDRYDPRSNQWRSDVFLPRARGAMAAGVIGTTIVLVGGWSSDDPRTTSVDRYDVASGRWSSGARIPAPRQAAASAVLGSRLYVVGGMVEVNGRQVPTALVESYDLLTDTWRREPPLPVAVGYAAAATVGDAIYVAGGVSGPETRGARSTTFVFAGPTSVRAR